MNPLKKLLGLPNAALRKIAEVAVVRWLRNSGAADPGTFRRRAYDALAGVKTLSGVLIGGAGFIAWGLGFDAASDCLLWLGSVGVLAGLADRAVRTPGRPEALANSAWYRFLADNAGMLSTLLGSAWAYVVSAGCTALSVGSYVVACSTQQQILGGVTLALVYLGVIDQGFLGKTPMQARFTRLGQIVP